MLINFSLLCKSHKDLRVEDCQSIYKTSKPESELVSEPALLIHECELRCVCVSGCVCNVLNELKLGLELLF